MHSMIYIPTYNNRGEFDALAGKQVKDLKIGIWSLRALNLEDISLPIDLLNIYSATL